MSGVHHRSQGHSRSNNNNNNHDDFAPLVRRMGGDKKSASGIVRNFMLIKKRIGWWGIAGLVFVVTLVVYLSGGGGGGGDGNKKERSSSYARTSPQMAEEQVAAAASEVYDASKLAAVPQDGDKSDIHQDVTPSAKEAQPQEETKPSADDETTKQSASTETPKKTLSSTSSEYDLPPTQPLSISDVAERFEIARKKWFRLLKKEYGSKTFFKIFGSVTMRDRTRGRTVFRSPSTKEQQEGPSWDRWKRKLQIKVLQVLQQNVQDHRDGSTQTQPARFVWVTAGNGAAAGHGNLFNQSYTAYLERAFSPFLHDVFAGSMEFVARNMAMADNMPSGAQLALCCEQVFGNDVDVLTWEFAKADGLQPTQLQLFMYRGALASAQRGGRSNSTTTVLLMDWNEFRIKALRSLEERGMTTLYMAGRTSSNGSDDSYQAILKAIPDTKDLKDEIIASMPPYIRNLKCQGELEKGEPHCSNEKWDDSICPDRRFRKSWNPGWKANALKGNLMALLLMEVLQDAIDQLHREAVATLDQITALLERLQSQENADYQQLLSARLPARAFTEFISMAFRRADAYEQDHLIEMLFRDRAICHTGLLPSQSRYRGVVQDDVMHPITQQSLELVREENGDRWIIPASPHTSDSIKQSLPAATTAKSGNDTNHRATKTSSSSGLRLIAELGDRQACPEALLNVDHADYFYLSHHEGEQTFTLPNQAELQDYDSKKPLRVTAKIAICYSAGSDLADAHHLHGDSVFSSGRLSIMVGEKYDVDGLNHIALLNSNDRRGSGASHEMCYFLRHEHGLDFSSSTGQFTISMIVLHPGDYIKLSSFILWLQEDKTPPPPLETEVVERVSGGGDTSQETETSEEGDGIPNPEQEEASSASAENGSDENETTSTTSSDDHDDSSTAEKSNADADESTHASEDDETGGEAPATEETGAADGEAESTHNSEDEREWADDADKEAVRTADDTESGEAQPASSDDDKDATTGNSKQATHNSEDERKWAEEADKEAARTTGDIESSPAHAESEDSKDEAGDSDDEATHNSESEDSKDEAGDSDDEATHNSEDEREWADEADKEGAKTANDIESSKRQESTTGSSSDGDDAGSSSTSVDDASTASAEEGPSGDKASTDEESSATTEKDSEDDPSDDQASYSQSGDGDETRKAGMGSKRASERGSDWGQNSPDTKGSTSAEDGDEQDASASNDPATGNKASNQGSNWGQNSEDTKGSDKAGSDDGEKNEKGSDWGQDSDATEKSEDDAEDKPSHDHTSSDTASADGKEDAEKTAAGSALQGGDVSGNAADTNSDVVAEKPKSANLGSLSSSISKLQDKFNKAKENLFDMLKADYGEKVFEEVWLSDDKSSTRGRTVLVSPSNPGGKDRTTKVMGPSWERVVRKMQIKLLRVILHGNEEKVKFVWATGGHSAAASHGNLFNESYTSYMERAIAPVFESVGIDFVGRNYAIGSQHSAPQIALCAQSLFGMDYDVLSWDYGMTDARQMAQQDLYFYRGAMNAKQRPTMVMFGWNPLRRDAAKELENVGLPVFYMDGFGELPHMEEFVPDTADDLTQAEIDALAPFVRYYKCKGFFEKGEPGCGDNKWSMHYCDNRLFRTSWHPGWKAQAFRGNIAALFLLEVLEDALGELSTHTTAEAALELLLEQDVKLYNQFWSSNIPERAFAEWETPKGFTKEETNAWVQVLYRQPAICHTSLLPSQSRYKGIFNGEPIDDPQQLEMQLMDAKSISPDKIQENRLTPDTTFQWELGAKQLNSRVVRAGGGPQPSSDKIHEPRLVAEMKERQNCFVLVNIDHRDYFYVDHTEGPTQMVVPNAAERQAYVGDRGRPNGVVVLCFSMPLGKDEKQIVGYQSPIETGRLEVKINEQNASQLSHIVLTHGGGSDCYLVHNASNGMEFPVPDSNQMSIRVQVLKPGEYAKLSSYIVFWTKDGKTEPAAASSSALDSVVERLSSQQQKPKEGGAKRRYRLRRP